MTDTATSVENNVCRIADADLCIGCGLCAGICPTGKLRIEFNEYGEYVVRETAASCNQCGLCLQVCPFSDRSKDEDVLGRRLFAGAAGMKHTPETGYYLESLIGHSAVGGHRENGSSGGLATWMLESLLESGLVDHVVCVSPTTEPGHLFDFVICNTPHEVRRCSRSCYYPVETSRVVRHILSHDGRYAVIALPCVVKAFRLAAEVQPKLRERVRFLLGLVCGQSKSKSFAECVCAMGGGDPRRLKKITFRVKDPARPAADFGTRCTCGDASAGQRETTVFFYQGVSRLWSDRFFTPNSCDFCDDVFAELADATFMDAWLGEYSHDPRGHSIVVVRDAELLKLIEEGRSKGSLRVQPLDINSVIASQRGGLRNKRQYLPRRIRLAEAAGRAVPSKRLHLCGSGRSPVHGALVKCLWRASRASRREWVRCGKDLQRFRRAMAPVLNRLGPMRWLGRFYRLAVRSLAKPYGVTRLLRRAFANSQKSR